MPEEVAIKVKGKKCPVCGRRLSKKDWEWGECLGCGTPIRR